jgi:two-component system response regulator FixJ
MPIDDHVVHIVEDDEAVRKSLAFLLTTSGFAVRVHDSATSFLAAAPDIGKACLITDLSMPDMSGVDLLNRLNEIEVAVPAIVITGSGDVPLAVAAMRAGASDFIEKPFDNDVLVGAIRRALSRFDPRGGATQDLSALRARLDLLSDRERQVMTDVVAGRSNKAIGEDLNIDPRTVEIHRANVMAKMQAGSLPELVRFAMMLEQPATDGAVDPS